MSAILKENLSKEQSTGEKESLTKNLGLTDAIMMVVGIVIGSGIFFKSSTVFAAAGNPFMGIMAWIFGGLVTIASALTISEISTAIPKTGGVFVYLKELYGERLAFLFGWVQSLIYVPGVTAALSIMLVTQATFFVPLSDVSQRVLAISLIFLLIFLNMISTKLGSRVQLISTIGKLIPIGIIILFGFIKGTVGGVSAASTFSLSNTTISGFGAAILGTLWAYDGWVGVTNIAGELKNPGKDLPKSIIMGLSLTIFVYILINIAIINVIPVEQVMMSVTPASDAAVIMFGSAGAALISGGIMVSIFGAMNGYLITGVRIPYAMAKDKLFLMPNTLGKIDSRFKTPVAAFLMEGCLASLYVMTGSFEILTNLAMFMVWLFFIITVAGIFILRTKFKDMPRTYKVPLYPIVPLVGIAGGIYIIGSTIFTDTYTALFGLLVTLTGVPVYSYIKKKYI